MKPASPLWLLLFFAAALHCLVDLVAGSLNPLWPLFDGHYKLTPWQGAGLFFLWQMTTSLSQFFFGMWGDRFNSRWLLWAGPLAAVVCLGSIGLTKSPIILAQLLVISGLGIAAFHPEAAALAGSCAPENRSRAMSIFTTGGFIGQSIGPYCSGNLVDWLGMRGLAWGILGGLAALLLLAPLGFLAMKSNPAASNPSGRIGPPVRLAALFRGRARPLLLVLVIGSLRIVAAAGVPILLGYLLQARSASAGDTGFVQSAFMLGIGLGGLTCATLLKRQHERTILWLCPLLVSPLLLVVPWMSGLALAALTCLSGVLLGISLPVLISLGQELMPDSQRIASSITMGVSWGVGGGIVSLILAGCQYAGRFEPAFAVFAVATLASTVLCAWLPRLAANEIPEPVLQPRPCSEP
jgi:FSR family fosmidomycin resistance protein-like MFS transporter